MRSLPRSRWLAGLLAVAVTGLLTGCQLTNPATGADTSVPSAAAPASAQLSTLRVAADGPMTDYSRAQFGDGWETQPDHCDSRVDVLKAEDQQQAPTSCSITTGRWLSLYDGLTVTSAHDLDIDHLVPLGNAWVTGARTWTPAQRQAFANDVSTELIAVSAHSNRSKGDQPPPGYEPPSRAEDCSYAQRWITIKNKYRLTVTQVEHDALAQMLTTC